MKKNNLFKYSLITTTILIAWTIYLPFINSEEWFVNRQNHMMWLGFDTILSLTLIILTYGLYKKRKFVKFLSPMIFGMILTDWIFNILLWIYNGYNLLELRFIVSYVFIAAIIGYFYWFCNKIYRS